MIYLELDLFDYFDVEIAFGELSAYGRVGSSLSPEQYYLLRYLFFLVYTSLSLYFTDNKYLEIR